MQVRVETATVWPSATSTHGSTSVEAIAYPMPSSVLDAAKELIASYPSLDEIVFTKGGGGWLEAMADLGCDALGLDWTVDLGAARARVGHKVALQGNLDPQLLVAGGTAMRAEAERIIQTLTKGRFVFNLGHGIVPETPPENVEILSTFLRESRA